MRSATLQGANLESANLQGAHSCKNEDYSFSKRILRYANRESDLNCIDKRTLSKEKKRGAYKRVKRDLQ